MAKKPMSTAPPAHSSPEMAPWWRRLTRGDESGRDGLTSAEPRGGAVAVAEEETDELSLGEMDGLTDELTMTDGDALALSDNWTIGLDDGWAVGLTDELTVAETLGLRPTETNGLALGETDAGGDPRSHAEGSETGESEGAPPTNGRKLGLWDGETGARAGANTSGFADGLALGESDGLAEGLTPTNGNALDLSDDWTIGLPDGWTIGLDDELTLGGLLNGSLAGKDGLTPGCTDADGDKHSRTEGLKVGETNRGTPPNGKRKVGETNRGTSANGKRRGLADGGTGPVTDGDALAHVEGLKVGESNRGTPPNGKRLGLADADGDTRPRTEGLRVDETNRGAPPNGKRLGLADADHDPQADGDGSAAADERTDPPPPSDPARGAGAGRGRRRSAGGGPKGPVRRARSIPGVTPIRAQLRAQPEPEYSEAVARYLTDGIFDEKHRADILRLGVQRSDFAQAWRALGSRITAAWIGRHPGSRPWGWWHFDAPRWQRSDLPPRWRNLGSMFLNQLGEPRRRLGGVGTPSYEVLNVVPDFDYGLPTSWVSAWDESYYGGEDQVILDQRIGAEPAEGHFAVLAPRADDPPVYESQASYLHRHGLMSPAEVQRLSADAFEPEVIDVQADDAVASASGNGVMNSTRWTATASSG